MDIEYLLWLQHLREVSGDALSPILMTLSDLMIGLVPLFAVAFVYLCVNKHWGYYIMGCVFSATLLNQFMKNTFCVYRPWIRCADIHPYGHSIAKATGYSFPSGHATTASSFFGSFAAIFRRRLWVVALCATCALLVCFSRNYLGVHTPQDVAVGLTEGIAMLFIVDRFKKANKDGRFDRPLVMCGLMFVALFLCYSTLKPYPIDYDADGNILVEAAKMINDCYLTSGLIAGILTGWYTEKHYIRMPMDKIWYTYLWRIVLAVLLILTYAMVLIPVLEHVTGHDWASFLLTFGLVWIITVVVPATGKLCGCLKKLTYD